MADTTKGPSELKAEAEHLRRLARGITDTQVLTEIRRLIEELETRAAALEENKDKQD